jgi:GAF domain-containing protein
MSKKGARVLPSGGRSRGRDSRSGDSRRHDRFEATRTAADGDGGVGQSRAADAASGVVRVDAPRGRDNGGLPPAGKTGAARNGGPRAASGGDRSGNGVRRAGTPPRVSKITSAQDVLPRIDPPAARTSLEAELRQRERERNWLRGVLEVSRAITTSLVPEKVAREIYKQLSRMIPGIDSFYIASIDEGREELQFILASEGGRPAKTFPGILSKEDDWGQAGKVVERREAIFIDDARIARDRSTFRRYNGGRPPRTYFGLPLISGDKLVGVMSVQSYKPHAFDEEQRHFIQAVAYQTAIALENALLHEHQLSQRLLVLKRLYETMGAIRTALNAEQVLDLIVGHLKELFGLTTCTIGLVDPARKKVEVVAERGLGRRVTRQLKDLPRGLVRRVMTSHQPVEIKDLSRRPALKRALVRPDINALVILPLHGEQNLHGVITMGSKEAIGLPPEQKSLLRAMADQAAIAIENARLHQLSEAWAQQLETLSQMSLDIALPTRRDELLGNIIRVAATLLRSPGGGLYFLNETRDELVLEQTKNLPGSLEKIHFKPGNSVIGRVLADEKPIAIDNYRHWRYRLRKLDPLNLSAVVGAPIYCEGEIIGVIVVNHDKEGHAYTEADKELLRRFGEHAGAAIQRVQQAIREKAELLAEEEIGARMAQALTVELDYRALLGKVRAVLRQHLGYDDVSLFLSTDFADELKVAVRPGYARGGPRIAPIKIGHGVVGRVAKDGVLMNVPNVKREPIYKRGLGYGSEIAIPLVIGGHVIGVLDVESKKIGAFGERDERILTRVAASLAIAIESAEKTAHLKTLADLSVAVAKSGSLSEILRMVTRQMLNACPATFCHIMLRTRDELPYLRVRDARSTRRLDWDPRRGKTCEILFDPRVARAARLDEYLVLKRGEAKDRPLLDSLKRHVALKGGNINSALLVPLRGSEGRVIGLCLLGEMRRWDRSHLTQQDNIRFATTLASQAAVAIEKGRDKELASQGTRTMERLHEVGNTLTGTLTLKKVLKKIVDSGRRLLRAEVVSIFLVRRAGWLTLETSSGSAPESNRDVDLEIKTFDGLTGHIAKVGRLFNKHGEELTGHPAVTNPGSQPHLPSGNCHAMIAMPLRRTKGGRSELVGLIKVENKLDDANRVAPSRRFDRIDTLVLKTLASYAETALRNVELYNLANRSKEVAEAVNSTLNMDEVLDLVLKQLKQLIPFDTASIQLLHGGEMKVVACSGFHGAERKKVLNLSFPLTGEFPNLRVIRYKRPQRVPDIRATEFKHFWEAADRFCTGHIRSWFGVPLLRRGKVIGMISIESATTGLYTKIHENLATAFARQVASAVENAYIYRTTQSLLDMILGLTEDLNLPAVLNKLARSITDREGIIRADSAVIYLYNPDLDRVEERPYFAGLPPEEREWINIKDRPHSSVRRLVLSKRPRIRPDVSADPLLYRDRGFARRNGVASVGAFPLRVGNQPVGVMYVNYLSRHVIDKREKELLQLIAQKAALTIQLAREYKTVTEHLETAKVAARGLYTLSAWGHDTNRIRFNILTKLDLLKKSLNKPSPATLGHLKEAYQLAESVGTLTRQPIDLDHMSDLSVDEVFEDVRKKNEAVLDKKQIRVRAELRKLPRVYVNEWLLSQAFKNLTQNAIKAVGEGGAITVRGEEMGNSVYVEFADDGGGIPPEVKQHLFKRRATGDNKEGSGYGLLLSKVYLNACDGDLQLKQSDAKGTTFILKLPKSS